MVKEYEEYEYELLKFIVEVVLFLYVTAYFKFSHCNLIETRDYGSNLHSFGRLDQTNWSTQIAAHLQLGSTAWFPSFRNIFFQVLIHRGALRFFKLTPNKKAFWDLLYSKFTFFT